MGRYRAVRRLRPLLGADDNLLGLLDLVDTWRPTCTHTILSTQVSPNSRQIAGSVLRQGPRRANRWRYSGRLVPACPERADLYVHSVPLHGRPSRRGVGGRGNIRRSARVLPAARTQSGAHRSGSTANKRGEVRYWRDGAPQPPKDKGLSAVAWSGAERHATALQRLYGPRVPGEGFCAITVPRCVGGRDAALAFDVKAWPHVCR